MTTKKNRFGYFKYILVTLLFVFSSTDIYSQNISLHISGRVISNETQKAIEDASVQILPVMEDVESDYGIGISTEKNGTFDFHFNQELPIRIRFSHVSFQPFEMILSEKAEGLDLLIPLTPNILGEDMTVTAPLVTKVELEDTKTFDRISTVDVQQLASFDIYDLVSTLREVDVATQSITMQSVNTRGFNASANKRFLQLTDGIDNSAPGLSFPIGNLMGLPDLDVASVDVFPGPSSTEYGSSALNGVMIMTGRDPFEDQGLSLEFKAGVSELDLSGESFFVADGNTTYDMQGRYAKAITEKFAFKMTGAYSTGTDWAADNYDNIGFGEDYLLHPEIPGYNGVNVYGDESYVYQQVYNQEPYEDRNGNFISPPPNYGPVTRTGYREEDLVDYSVETTRLAASLQYKLNENYKLSLDGKYGYTNSLYTGDSRIRLEGFKMYQTSFRLDSDRLEVIGYNTWQDSGNSYDVNLLSESLISSAKLNSDWYRDFLTAYERGLFLYGVPAGNLVEARKFADSEYTLLPDSEARARFEPGTSEFQERSSEIKRSLDPENGAGIIDNSQLYHIQTTYKLPEIVSNSTTSVGGNYRFYDLDSKGTIFPDTGSNDITNSEYGFYIRQESSLIDEKLNINASVRYDKNENFKARISPQFGLNYTINDKHYFRFSYQNGFRYPGVREQFVDNNLGNARLIGGLPQNLSQYDLQQNAITEDAIDEFNEAVNSELGVNPRSPEAYNRTQAELKYLPILEDGIIKKDELLGINPEVVNAFEFGYKRLFTPQLFLDLNYYVSFYKNFIGVTRVIKPKTSPTEDLYVAAGQINNSLESDRLFIYSNAQDKMVVHGASFSLDYISGGFLASLNGSYSNLFENPSDPITPGFNTPPFKMNFEWGHREIAENIGFKMTYRFRTKYYWESTFLDGPIDMYGHFDFQFNVRIPKAKSTLKVGLTNMGISEYSNIYGGPEIGSIVFTTLNFNPKMFQ